MTPAWRNDGLRKPKRGRESRMTVEDETRRVVESYFAAWTTKDVRAAHAVLAGDLEFSGPTASYQSADAFLPALVKFAEMTKWARIVDLVVEGNRAALL